MTPMILRLSYTPLDLKISAAIGTVELTGLEMMCSCALGQWSAAASARALTIPALMLNRSSRVIPGLRGCVEGCGYWSLPEAAPSKRGTAGPKRNNSPRPQE